MFGSNYIEFTTVLPCKVACKYCGHSELAIEYFKNNKQRDRKLSLDNFIKCLDHLLPNYFIRFCGWGEPFHNEKTIDMILEASRRNFKIAVYSTLDGLTLDNWKKLRHVPFVCFVLHLPDKYMNLTIDENYLKLFDAVTSDVEKIALFKLNEPYHKEIIDIIKRKNLLDGNFKLIDRAGNIDFNDRPILKTSKKDYPLICAYTSELDKNIVLPDGSVYLCCMDMRLTEPLGNLIDQPITEILDSERIQDIKKRMQDGEIICRYCNESKSKFS